MSETLSTTPETAKTIGGVTIFNKNLSWVTIILIVVAVAAVIYFATKKNEA